MPTEVADLLSRHSSKMPTSHFKMYVRDVNRHFGFFKTVFIWNVFIYLNNYCYYEL